MARILNLLLVALYFMPSLVAKEIVFTTPRGENYILTISPQDTFLEVANLIQDFAFAEDESEDFVFEVLMDNDERSGKSIERILPVAHRNNPQSARNYYQPLSATEMQDIRYIILTLANKSIASILGHKSSLEAAGGRIDHIHPLRFLCYVFSDEELKVGIHNIKNKRWVWKDFIGGIKESLNHESNFQNMQEEYISNFSQIVEINMQLIHPTIQKRHWDEFIDTLITHVPRKGDPNRYDH